ncbi:hypothetical protein [Duganella sp. Root198D2]|uniref:hypothetical protein n=1 Tax=Duganella sp. Root198D2 TaxID=1736489 RepID=UPI00070BE068|nr:hypothetical protein [Duganella sp. Root198D2]KRB92367.1 hypothetical protein ASE26_05130 [Duganella sp. Root198D2]
MERLHHGNVEVSAIDAYFTVLAPGNRASCHSAPPEGPLDAANSCEISPSEKKKPLKNQGPGSGF